MERIRNSAIKTIVFPIFKLPLSIADCAALLEEYCGRLTAKFNANATYDAERNAPYINKVARWISAEYTNTKPSLMLYGDIGCGKTTTALAIKEMTDALKEANSSYLAYNRCYLSKEEQEQYYQWSSIHRVEIVNANDVVMSDAEYAKAKNLPVVIIDDFGIEPATIKHYGSQITPMIDIIYHRYNKRMPTIFTSNLDNTSIRKHYGERVYDRLCEWCNFIDYRGESLRK